MCFSIIGARARDAPQVYAYMYARIPYNLLHFKEQMIYLSNTRCLRRRSGGSRGGKSGHPPPIEVGNGVWHPLGGRKSNDIIVNLPKSNEFGPPVSLSATDLAPLWSMTKKR